MSAKKFLVPILSATLVLAIVPNATAAAKIPSKIISLSPSATEDLFAIGAAKQVIAVDDLSNFPKNTPVTKLSAFNPNVEALIAYKPDLIVIQSTATKADSIITQLRNLKIAVYVEHTPNNLAEAYAEISQLASITSHKTQAAKVIASMKTAIAQSIATKKLRRSSKFFHELDNTLYSATSSTFIGKVYADFNLTNIADGAATADDGGYPQLQSEYILKSDPQFIFLSDGEFGENAKTVAARPGWAGISAVAFNKVVILPSDIPSRWGPRLVDFYQFVGNSISTN